MAAINFELLHEHKCMVELGKYLQMFAIMIYDTKIR